MLSEKNIEAIKALTEALKLNYYPATQLSDELNNKIKSVLLDVLSNAY